MPLSINKEADKEEGIRLSFNLLVLIDLCKGNNGYKHLERKMDAESELRRWLRGNMGGLPVQENNNGIHEK